jgi:predicted Holliday junction resolvase-like endonuclease
MKTILKFIDDWGIRIMTLLVVIVFFKTCGTNTKIEKLTKNVESLEVNLKKEIKVEGLKTERRMIQSTDRKIMDVNRQSEIDKEISKIEK